MASVSKQIQNADEAISRNIESLAGQRALLSQNVLAQLRNLVEGVVVRIHTGKPDAEFNYAAVAPGLAFVKSKGNSIVSVDRRCWPSTTDDFGSRSFLIRTMLPRKYWLVAPETRASCMAEIRSSNNSPACSVVHA